MTLNVPARIDPEVFGVLQDIAKQPESALLRVRRQDLRPGALERIEPVRPSAWWLTAAERHLVEAHREDFAYLMRCQVISALHSNGDSDRDRLVKRSFGSELQFFMLSRASMRTRVLGGLKLGCGTFLHSEEEAIAAAVAPGPNSRGQGAALRAALAAGSVALRIRPHMSVHCNFGAAYLEAGELLSAKRSYQRTAEGASSQALKRSAHEGLGAVASLYGDWEDAFQNYRNACTFPDRDFVAVGCYLLNAMQLGMRDEAIEAQGQMREYLSSSPDGRTALVGGLESAIADHGWAPTREAEELARKCDDLSDSWCAATVLLGGVS